MNRYSTEAAELLSKAEMFEIKAGENISSNNNDSSCGICTTCLACTSTCTACTSKALDVILLP